MIESGVVEGYYRRLRPKGGRVVRRRVGVVDYLGEGEGEMGGRRRTPMVGPRGEEAMEMG